MLIEETLILDRSLVIPLIIMEIPTIILMVILIRCPLILRIVLKNLRSLNKNFNALLEEKMLKVDDLARNIDRVSLDVDSLKVRSSPPKHDIDESLKSMIISIDECKEITARMCVKEDCFVKACSSSFNENNDEDLKKLLMCLLLDLCFAI